MLSDPLECFELQDLASFRDEVGRKNNYDELYIDTPFDADNTLYKPHISINDKKVNIEKTLLTGSLEKSLLGMVWNGYDLRDLLKTFCPYCKSNMRQGYFDDEDEINPVESRFILEHCDSCKYWKLQNSFFHFVSSNIFELRYTALLSKVRDFSHKIPEACSYEMALWIKRNPQGWHDMNPTIFEKLVADIFRANYEHSEVFHVGKPSDGGVDVVFIDSGKRQWLIQAKRREKAKSSEPVSTIRSLIGTMFLEGMQYGAVVSTANHFTYQAYQAAQRAHEKGMFIELVDKGILRRMIENIVIPEKPWLPILKEKNLNAAKHFDKQIPSSQNKKLSL